MFCPWGSTVHSVIELLFPHIIVWCGGTDREGSIAAEKEGVPKVNIQTLLGLIRQATSWICGDQNGIRKRDWPHPKEEALTVSRDSLSFVCTSDCSRLSVSGVAGELSYCRNLMEFIHLTVGASKPCPLPLPGGSFEGEGFCTLSVTLSQSVW